MRSVAASAVVAGLAAGTASVASASPGSPAGPSDARACGAPAAGHASCHAVRLVSPARDWHPGPAGPAASGGGTGAPAALSPPSSGYYPADLQSAYGLANAAAAMVPGPSAPKVAIVDAYDDPNAATDLAAYRTSLSSATDTSTGLADKAIPPLCGGATTTGCVSFTKVDQSGGTNYPSGNTGWAEEESLDVDMISAVCPDCNIVLVEANTNSLSDLATAAAYATSLNPAAVTNSYGGNEFRGEGSYNGYYSGTTSTAMTAATGDSGYGVEYPAASPGLTAVGGTSLSYSGGPGTGSALSWNPQTVWSGAGSGCSRLESMPTWQADQGVYSRSGTCSRRQVGDVSAVADPNTGVAAYDTYGQSGWLVFGGTSVSTQIIGGAYGLAAGAGTLAPGPSALYPDSTSGGSGPTTGLVPVTSGSNGSCGDYLCNAADSLSSGYNGPAGLGTPDGIAAFSSAPSGSLSFTSAAQTITAGQASSAMTVGLSPAPTGSVNVDFNSSSANGRFSASSGGTWSLTLTVTVSSGGNSATFYYEDTTAGTPTLTASASGYTSTTQTESVVPGQLSSITVSPSSATVPLGGTQIYSATGTDQYGNPVAVTPTWSVSPSSLGNFSSSSANSSTFTASSSGSGTVTATSGAVSGMASVTVASGSLSFTSAAQTITAGQASSAMTVGLSPAPTGSVNVDFNSSSANGRFSTSSGGPWSAGPFPVTNSGSSASVYYEDTTAGSPTLTASASGYTSTTQTESVVPGQLASITVSPSSATVAQGGTQIYSATGTDQYGNPVAVTPTWSVSPSSLGNFSPTSGNSSTFTASSSGSGTVTATLGGVSGTASVTVTGLKTMTVAVTAGGTTQKGVNYKVPLTVAANDASSPYAPISGANVILEVFANSTCSGSAVASGTGTTGTNGTAAFTFTTKQAGAWCALAMVTATGYNTGTSQPTPFST